MKNVFEYKGYTGSVKFSADDDVFFGKITGIRDVVTFEDAGVTTLKKNFQGSSRGLHVKPSTKIRAMNLKAALM